MKFYSSLNKTGSYYSKKRHFKKILVLIFLAVILIATLNLFQTRTRSFFYAISSPFQKVLWNSGMSISNFFGTIGDVENIRIKNEELRQENQSLIYEISSLQDLKKENEILRGALQINLQKEFKLIPAKIIGKDIIDNSIIIDAGSKQGVVKNLPIITQQKVLCGTVNDVYSKTSKIKLIFDEKSSFSVKIRPLFLDPQDPNPPEEIYGVIKGQGNLGLYADLIPQNKVIKAGDILSTAKLGGEFPEGLLVGSVKSVIRNDLEPFQGAEIFPFFDITNLDTVFIIAEF